VKRTSRDEPMWVAMHRCIETAQGISLCSYLYLKLEKNAMFLLLYFMFFFYIDMRAGQVLTEGG
jgi:hypothetical protein